MIGSLSRGVRTLHWVDQLGPSPLTTKIKPSDPIHPAMEWEEASEASHPIIHRNAPNATNGSGATDTGLGGRGSIGRFNSIEAIDCRRSTSHVHAHFAITGHRSKRKRALLPPAALGCASGLLRATAGFERSSCPSPENGSAMRSLLVFGRTHTRAHTDRPTAAAASAHDRWRGSLG